MWCGAIPLFFDTPQGTFLPALSLAAVLNFAERAGSADRPTRWRRRRRSVHPHRSRRRRWCSTSPRSSRIRSNEISAAKVLDGSFDPKRVAGKIVFIGATDPLSGDVRLAPTNKSSRLPGVFLHANAANTILTGTYLEASSDTTTLLWVALLTVARRPARADAPVVAVAVAHPGARVRLRRRSSSGASTTASVTNLVYPLVALVAAFLGAVVLRYFGETRQRRRVTALSRSTFPRRSRNAWSTRTGPRPRPKASAST